MINNKRCRTCNNNMMMMCAFVSCWMLNRMLSLACTPWASIWHKRSTFHKRQVVTSVCYCISQTKSSQKQKTKQRQQQYNISTNNDNNSNGNGGRVSNNGNIQTISNRIEEC